MNLLTHVKVKLILKAKTQTYWQSHRALRGGTKTHKIHKYFVFIYYIYMLTRTKECFKSKTFKSSLNHLETGGCVCKETILLNTILVNNIYSRSENPPSVFQDYITQNTLFSNNSSTPLVSFTHLICSFIHIPLLT